MAWRYMQLGGPIMWPLALCSIILAALLIERFWTIAVKGKCFKQSLTLETMTFHKRVLPFFTDIPPGLGLLGTVIGVVQSFQLVEGRLSGEMVGAGLGVACLTTIFGLAIAIVASISTYCLDWMTSQALDAETQS